MSLIRYTPYNLSNLQQQINRMFDQVDNEFGGRSEGLGGGMFTPAVDIKEDADAYTVSLEAPGVKQENLNLTLQDNVLTIRGHKQQKQEQGEGQYRRVECSYGSFARSLSLPRNVDGNGVTADLHDGVLTVRLPKHEAAKPRQINIGTSRQGNTVEGVEVAGDSNQATPAQNDQAASKPKASGGSKKSKS